MYYLMAITNFYVCGAYYNHTCILNISENATIENDSYACSIFVANT
jgi:hypothetical protein